MIDRLVEVLPKIARELAAPYGNIKDLTVISTDGAGQLSRNVAGNVNDTVTMLEKMTGVDLRQLVDRVASGRTQPPVPATPAAVVVDGHRGA